jgi:TonB family protein
LTSIQFTGFSPEGERELRSRLPIREGDIITATAMTGVSAAVRAFDSHAMVDVISRNVGGVAETQLRIRISPQAASQIVFRSQTDAPPPPLPPPPPGTVRIGPGIRPPQLTFSPEPEYSAEASKARWQGTVTLAIVVDVSGQPTNITVVRPLGLGLDQKAIEAVQLWRFTPGMKDGQPVPVQASVEVNFRLPN